MLITGQKGTTAAALALDVYIDDNLDNICAVTRESPATRAYLLHYRYNSLSPADAGPFTRVYRLSEMFDREIQNL